MAAITDTVTLARRYRNDPLMWALIAYDWGHGELQAESGPRDWQRLVLAEIRDRLNDPDWREPIRIAVASGHGVGKSALMGMIADWGMSTFADTKIVVTANTKQQLTTKTAPEIATWFRRSISAIDKWFDIAIESIKSREASHRDTWRLDFITWSQENTEAFAGLHNKRKRIILLMDEASAIHDKVHEVAEGALTDEDTQIIWVMFGNPTRSTGRFREAFRRFRHRWWTLNVDARTVPGTNKTLIAQWEADYGVDSDWFKVRVRGMFPATSAKQFINGEDVDAARSRHLRPEQYKFAPIIIGVDPAWTGDDEFVIYMRQGLYTKRLGAYQKNDNDVLMAQIIARFEEELDADAVIVDAGFGTGIVSAGRAMGRSWHLIWFSGKSPDAGCLNMRAYMWDQMGKGLKEGMALDPHDDVLYYDLIGPEIVPRIDGKKQLESKEDMKERGQQSPNRADALALTFAMPVAKRTGALSTFVPIEEGNGRVQTTMVDKVEVYDPYEGL